MTSSHHGPYVQGYTRATLVIAHQHGAVNTFPGLVHTARHTIRVGGTRSRESNRKEDHAEGTLREGGEVVTR